MFDVYNVYSPYPNVTEHVTTSWAAFVSNLVQMINLSHGRDNPTLTVDLSRRALCKNWESIDKPWINTRLIVDWNADLPGPAKSDCRAAYIDLLAKKKTNLWWSRREGVIIAVPLIRDQIAAVQSRWACDVMPAQSRVVDVTT